MTPQRDLAIVLKTYPFEERHRVVHGYTELNGRVNVIARNAIQSRRFGGSLDTFAASEWTFEAKPGRELWSLQEATVRRSFEGIHRDFLKLSVGSACVEIILKGTPQYQPSRDLFLLLSNTLALLDELQSPDAAIPVLTLFIAKFLHLSGLKASWSTCSNCSTAIAELEDPALCVLVAEEARWKCISCAPFAKDALPAGHFSRIERLLSLPIRAAAEPTGLEVDGEKRTLQFLEAVLIHFVPGFDRHPIQSLRFLR